MAPTARWVIGRGLLGSAVDRLSAGGAMNVAINWQHSDETIEALQRGLDLLTAEDASRIEVYWCAGKAVTSSAAEALEAELAVFRTFTGMLEALPAHDRGRLAVFLASSVGGAYGAAEGPPFTEWTPARPSSSYGATKLAMEDALARATAAGGWRAFIARITNLYGPGQDLRKGQGLLSVITASYLTRRPASVYVSLDTLRDYIYEDDCARVVIAGTQRAHETPAGETTVKIVGSMAAQSIGAILGESRRLRGRPPLVILGQGKAAGQASDLRVRSQVWTDLDSLVLTTLPEGLDRLYRAQLASHGAGTR